MLTCKEGAWGQFLSFVEKKTSSIEFQNWLSPIKVLEMSEQFITLEVPNIFVREYLIDNYKQDMLSFLPINNDGEPAINFVIAENQNPSQTQQTLPKEEKKLSLAQ